MIYLGELIGALFALVFIVIALIIVVEINKSNEWHDVFRKDGRDD